MVSFARVGKAMTIPADCKEVFEEYKPLKLEFLEQYEVNRSKVGHVIENEAEMVEAHEAGNVRLVLCILCRSCVDFVF